MLYVCVRGVMDVVFFVCIVKHGAVGARLLPCKSSVMSPSVVPRMYLPRP